MRDAKNGLKSRRISQKLLTYDHQDRIEDEETLQGEWEDDAHDFPFRKAWKGILYNR